MTARISVSVEGELRRELPTEVFSPRRVRLLWLPVHLGTIVGAFWFHGEIARWGLLPVASLFVGLAFGGLLFVGHETLHGAIVRNRFWMRVVGFLCMTPLNLSPRLWMAWHNRTHHPNTNRPGKDPDAYPTREEYERSSLARFTLDVAAPGEGRARGLLTHLVGFSLQSAHVLLAAKGLGLSRRQRVFVWLETLAMVALWTNVAFLVGGTSFFWLYGVPLLIANAIVMTFIVTNHSLSRTGDHVDTLESSLSVTVPRFVDLYTLGFGYHVEHHLFPTMSHYHGPRVRELLRRRYPSRYQSLPLGRALRLLYRTPRVHLAPDRLWSPKTGAVHPTLPELLGPRVDAAPASAREKTASRR